MDSAPLPARASPLSGGRKAATARWKRAPPAPAKFANLLNLQPLPRWIANSAQAGEREGGTIFAAGAAAHALDAVVRAAPLWLGCWRMRLTLKAAVSAARLLRIEADEPSLRDALHLTRPGDDPGPAGRLHAALRRWADRPLRLAEETEAAMLAEAGEGRGAAEFAALLAADRGLGERLGWALPLPLHLATIHDPALRRGREGGRPRADEPGWEQARHAVLLAGAIAAYAEAVSLERRAEALTTCFAHLRSRDGGEAALRQVLSDDSVAPWRMAGAGEEGERGAAKRGLGSDRAARRFCEGLHATGTLRLLTDRPTFRLYGL
jgi:hypothetical protein